MRTISIMCLTTVVVFLSGCQPCSSPGRPSVEGKYDNHGGVAYGGHVVDLKENGTFKEWMYSDVINEDKHEKKGTWTQTNETIRLEYKDGTSRSMYTFRDGANLLLLTEGEFEEAKKDRSALRRLRPMKR